MTQKGFYNIFLFVSFVLLYHDLIHAQGGTQVEFGQNRVQYHDFDWQSHESNNFITYFYPGGQELAKFMVISAEEEMKNLEKRLNYSIGDKIEILIYNNISDLGQTNIGISENKYNVGGTNYTEGTKIFLYFDGRHQHMLNVFKKELAKVFLNKMMSGRNFAEVVKNAVFLNLPGWYISGLSSFLGESWNTELDDRLRRYWSESKKPSFAKLSQADNEFAGHALWYYIFNLYGEKGIKDIVFLTRIHRSVKKGLNLSIGKTEDELIADWEEYCKKMTEDDLSQREYPEQNDRLKIKVRRNQIINQISLSPDGNHIAYSIHKYGRYRVFVKNIETGKTKRIFTGGFNSDNYPYDYSYPILIWSPSGSVFTGIHEKRDQIKQVNYDVPEKVKIKEDIRGFQRVYSASYTPDGRSLIMSAQNRGQTDIYSYHLINRTPNQVNRDIFDDLYPEQINLSQTRGIIYSGNKNDVTRNNETLDSILPTGNLNLYFTDLQNEKVRLSKLTDNPLAEHIQSQRLEGDSFTYLSDESGIFNLYKGEIKRVLSHVDTISNTDNLILDSVFTFILKSVPLTNLHSNIKQYSSAPKTGKWAYLIENGGRASVYLSNIEPASSRLDIPATTYRKSFLELGESSSNSGSTPSNNRGEIQKELDSLLSQPSKFSFHSKFNYRLPTQEEKISQKKLYLDSLRTISEEDYQSAVLSERGDYDSPFRAGLSVPYRAKFSTNFLTTQVDNSVLPFTYESVAQNGASFEYPNIGGMIMYGIQDLMEDHKLTGGFRFPMDFKGSEVFVSYENLKKRLDKRFLFYRKSGQEEFSLIVNNLFIIPALAKKKSHYLETRLSYPIDVTKSIRLYAGYRNDRLLFTYTDTITMIADIDRNENWSLLKLEFVHDNTKELQLNIYNGFRYKFYTEYFKNWNKKKTNLFTVGYDIRHYTSVFKNIIWANRLAGATSFGQKKIRYYIGGTDTWINNKYDYNTAAPNMNEYAFQAHSTNVRGFPINIRNGSSNMIFNSELRVPIFSLIAKKSFKSAFIQNFQLAGFFDVGSAFNGLTPFNKNNPFVTERVTPGAQQTPVVVDVKYYRNPTVMGTGFGLRTLLLGYLMKLDWAWGIDGKIVNKKPMWIFSFSKDF